ncbi:hypothetical protein H735_06755 [Vibrio owensii CAIM 1854 = LMG 25443]|uniref:Uncharacterized protein n=1 Tax=Vibrio owensii CAIM 1854 = LMG 25443 TaxID=1229493 RepID=A0A0C1VVV0_9VIBR|nr:hypothetical protein H735_06755 [Vibrio owensii CAIM 1854 = LMG 25443]
MIGDYALIHDFPELKQHLVDNNGKKSAMRDVLGVIYLIDCYFTGRHKHRSNQSLMAVSQKLLQKLFGQTQSYSMVNWKESDLLGKFAEVNSQHLLSKFMYTTGVYDKESGESRAWGFKPMMLERLYDFTSGYRGYIKNVPNGMRPTGRMVSVQVGSIPKVDKWGDSVSGVTGKNHSDIAKQCNVATHTVKNWVKSGRIHLNPVSEFVGVPCLLADCHIDTYIHRYIHKELSFSQKSTFYVCTPCCT